MSRITARISTAVTHLHPGQCRHLVQRARVARDLTRVQEGEPQLPQPAVEGDQQYVLLDPFHLQHFALSQ